MAATDGVGCTVIVKFCGVPVQVIPPKVYLGVTMMVAATAVAPALVAAKEAMLPDPLAARPIEVVLLVQSKDVAVPLKLMDAVLPPLHTTWLEGSVTVGVGLTVIVKDFVGPLHITPPVNTGVTTMVATTGLVPALMAANAPMLPVPLAARPIEVLLLVHV
jgi:hypothetical protein